MELRWLEDFIALARTRHFSRAAETQNVTQPTFSRRIKLLEEEMGTTLINRQTLPLSLTPAGEEFLALCQDVTRRVATTRERLEQLTQADAGRIRLAAPQSLLANFLPEWLAGFASAPPVVPYLRATGWLVDDYFQALRRNECDLALCYWPAGACSLSFDTEGLDVVTLGEERLVPVSQPDADGRPRFSLEDAGRRPLPLIAYHPRGLIDQSIRAHLEGLGEIPTFSVLNESIQSGNIRELVGLGYGLGWLPKRTVQAALSAGSLVPAGGIRWEVPLEVRLYRHRGNPHSAVDALWQRLATAPVDGT
ncbi:LysR family transcriptional regulator [Halomonas organivorans]|uniref:DNA-binding transcriptional LysR family regulator n=1 Tax=Halomonas organivorans TaxID=257772 RepID=A0A7W5BXG2_9GAMM|nr:LysR family transcriptional regulator [Halomonas organivorans]MBB3140935.1 DNA-binding transcriptional LysR family regulator [Halomonas organivorans]